PAPIPTLFPYTTLFRSLDLAQEGGDRKAGGSHGAQGRRADGRRDLPSVQRVRACERNRSGARAVVKRAASNPRAHAHSRRDRFRSEEHTSELQSLTNLV